MSLQEIWQQFLSNVRDTRWPEWVSAAAQVLSVWFARKNNILVFPTGITGVLLAAWVYLFMVHPPLYANGILHIYYFGMSVYGWYNWVQKKESGQYVYPISWCTRQQRIAGSGLFLFFWALLYYLLDQHTDSNTPVLDSLVSSSAFTAMWWMAKRKIENWLAWIFSNIVAIPLNFHKGLMLYSLMYMLFLIMAWWGFNKWKKIADANGNKSLIQADR